MTLWRYRWYARFRVWLDNITRFKAVRIESSQRKSYPYKNNKLKDYLYVEWGIKR